MCTIQNGFLYGQEFVDSPAVNSSLLQQISILHMPPSIDVSYLQQNTAPLFL